MPVPLSGSWKGGGFWLAQDVPEATGEYVSAVAPQEGDHALETEGVVIGTYSSGGKCLELNAASSIRCDPIASILPSGGCATVVADIAPDATNCPVLAFSSPGDASYASVYVNAVGNLSFALRASGVSAKAGINRRVILGGRQILAAVLTPSSARVYLDGVAGVEISHAMSTVGISRVTVGSWLTLRASARLRALAVATRELSISEIDEVRAYLHGRPFIVRPMGDSVMKGVGDAGPDGKDGRAGLRWLLSQWCAQQGITIAMVGSLDDGQWAHTRHDGVCGSDIDRVRAYIAGTPSTGADFVPLVMGGADLGWPNRPAYDPALTPMKYAAALEELLAKEARAVVLPTTVVPFNDSQYPVQAAAGRDLNEKLVSSIFPEAEERNPLRVRHWDGFHALGGVYRPEKFATLSDGSPDTHPGPSGYADMFFGERGLLAALKSL